MLNNCTEFNDDIHHNVMILKQNGAQVEKMHDNASN